MEKDESILLAKWLDQRITAAELKQLEKEVDLTQLAAVLNLQEALDFELEGEEVLWEKFGNKIDLDSSISTKESTVTLNKNNTTRKFIPWILLLLIALIAGLFYFYNNENTKIETKPKEQRTKIYADGTKVEISPGSELTYKEANWDKERQINLKGQAFFEVTKGAPFVVNTSNGFVEVLGTSFDIWSFENIMKVQCFEGRVAIGSADTGESVEITAGQVVFINSGLLSNIESHQDNSAGWLTNKEQTYKGIPARLVLQDLERFFELKVDSKQVDTSVLFSGLIPLVTAEEACRYFALSMGWNYTLDNGVLQIKQ